MSANSGDGSSSTPGTSSGAGGGSGQQQQQQSQSAALEKSHELCYHNLDCPFYLLSRQKSNLLTDSEIHSELVAHYLRKWNTTLESSGGSVVARAMAYSNQALDTGKVREYLNSQRSQLDQMIERELAHCQCITARILQPANLTGNLEVKVEQEGEVEEEQEEGVNSPPILFKEEPIQIHIEEELGESETNEEEERVIVVLEDHM